jgi:hypothetical protein
MLLTALAVTVVCLGAIGAFIASADRAAMDDNVRKENGTSAAAAHAQSRLTAFDASHPLQRGGTIVVYQDGRSALGEVAAGANESVLLRRGGNLQGLYMVGGKGCVVVSDSGTRVVRDHEVVATVKPAQEAQR